MSVFKLICWLSSINTSWILIYTFFWFYASFYFFTIHLLCLISSCILSFRGLWIQHISRCGCDMYLFFSGKIKKHKKMHKEWRIYKPQHVTAASAVTKATTLAVHIWTNPTLPIVLYWGIWFYLGTICPFCSPALSLVYISTVGVVWWDFLPLPSSLQSS